MWFTEKKKQIKTQNKHCLQTKLVFTNICSRHFHSLFHLILVITLCDENYYFRVTHAKWGPKRLLVNTLFEVAEQVVKPRSLWLEWPCYKYNSGFCLITLRCTERTETTSNKGKGHHVVTKVFAKLQLCKNMKRENIAFHTGAQENLLFHMEKGQNTPIC